MHIGKQYPYALFQRMYNADLPWPYLWGKFYRLHCAAFHFLNPVPIWAFHVPVEMPDIPVMPGPLELMSGPQFFGTHSIEFGWRCSMAQLNAQVYGEFSIKVDGHPAVDPWSVPLGGNDGRGIAHLWFRTSEIHFPGSVPGDLVEMTLAVRNWGDLPRAYP